MVRQLSIKQSVKNKHLRLGYDFMVDVAQLVRALDCGSRGCGFEARHSPHNIRGHGGMVDTHVREACGRNPVSVQVRLTAPSL